ncbi:MAG: response regulator transcription factor [Prolixibacteraceae bacterium]|nr:response regulator transcription factor [Prolixibacteraceae bacterium]
MIKAVIVDDEPFHRETIQMLLDDYFPDVCIVAQAEGVGDAVAVLELHQPELVFLDIEIKGGTGFHVLQKLKKRDFKLIFITAFNEFALQAIKFSAIDYILKPINEFEFKAGVERAIQEIEKQEVVAPIEYLVSNYQDKADKKLVLRTSQELHVVNVTDVMRCEADNAYTTFYLESGEKIVVSKGLSEYAEMLENYGFVRPHQSHLVNLSFIRKLDKSDGGFLVLKDKSEIPVSARKKQQIIDFLNRL